MNEPKLRIGELAELAGLRASALRYYEEIGLIPEPERVSGQRVYERSVLRRLAAIDASQRAGLSLDEIRELLDAGTEPISPKMQELAARKLPEVEALIERAEAMREWLRAAESCRCESIDECALFDPRTLDYASDSRLSARGASTDGSTRSKRAGQLGNHQL